MTGGSRRGTGSIVGVAGLACVACCAGPFVAGLTAAGIGLATVAGIALFGVAGVAVLFLAVPVLWRRRRRTASGATGPVAVAAPLVRRPVPDDRADLG